ncbi:MAG: TldD/PmbA family protein [Clostridia bacterium]|nr:TldD/PmbA family protein [Clostridia bacterium]
MISRKIAEQTLAEALRTGGDFAELFVQDKKSTVLALLDNRIDNAVTGRIHGAGIRIFKGLSSVYVHTNDTSLSGLITAARKAADALGSGNIAVDVNLTGSILTNIHPIAQLPMDVPGSRKAALLKSANAAARDVSSEIKQVSVNLSSNEGNILIANSDGLFTTDSRVYTRIGITAIAAGSGENQIGSSAPGALMGYELFETRVDVEERAREAAKQAVTMLHADACPAGFMPVVIDGGFGGVIFHEACGHSLEAASVAFGSSEFCGKLGQQVASPIVTAIDDGTLPNEWGSTNIDDEGHPTTKLTLIENGVLKNYMIDKLNGRRMNMPATGSSRRQDYTYAPTSRMRNTYIAAGEHDEAEIISSCGDGLYAKKMGGGSVNPVTGEFNFSVGEGYLIKNGRIDRPVRGATLIGRGTEVLMKIDRVGKKMWMDQGMCGAGSGQIPANVGQPMIRLTGITVGGR